MSRFKVGDLVVLPHTGERLLVTAVHGGTVSVIRGVGPVDYTKRAVEDLLGEKQEERLDQEELIQTGIIIGADARS